MQRLKKHTNINPDFNVRVCWYGHYPKMHEMVSDGNSKAGFGTDICEISMRVFFDFKQMPRWSNNKHVSVRVKQIDKPKCASKFR